MAPPVTLNPRQSIVDSTPPPEMIYRLSLPPHTPKYAYHVVYMHILQIIMVFTSGQCIPESSQRRLRVLNSTTPYCNTGMHVICTVTLRNIENLTSLGRYLNLRGGGSLVHPQYWQGGGGGLSPSYPNKQVVHLIENNREFITKSPVAPRRQRINYSITYSYPEVASKHCTLVGFAHYTSAGYVVIH